MRECNVLKLVIRLRKCLYRTYPRFVQIDARIYWYIRTIIFCSNIDAVKSGKHIAVPYRTEYSVQTTVCENHCSHYTMQQHKKKTRVWVNFFRQKILWWPKNIFHLEIVFPPLNYDWKSDFGHLRPAVYNTVVTLELACRCSRLRWSLLTPFIFIFIYSFSWR